jgi:hypothetical protein
VDINPRTVPRRMDPPLLSLEVAAYKNVGLYGVYRGTPLGQFEGAFLRDGKVGHYPRHPAVCSTESLWLQFSG